MTNGHVGLLGGSLLELSAMVDDCCNDKSEEPDQLALQTDQRRTLITVLAINTALFVVEFGGGLLAGSAALIADSADSLADAVVYGLTLYAMLRSDRWKAGAATIKGLFILAIVATVVFQIVQKLIYGAPPSSSLMIAFGALALVANLICLRMLWRFSGQDINMSSTFECSRNDVFGNIGVLSAAGLVAATASPWPDIFIAGLIATLFLRSAIRVLSEALPKLRAA
jgi:cation diffusion facilitator family transporter